MSEGRWVAPTASWRAKRRAGKEGSPNTLGNWLGRGLVGPINKEEIHDGIPLGTEEESGVVGWNEAEGRSNDIALDVGIREGWRVRPIEGALDINEPDDGIGRGPRVGPRHRRRWYALALCVPYSRGSGRCEFSSIRNRNKNGL